MRNRQAITILHLSDLQFGKNHRFGQMDLRESDVQFDTLLRRLRDDLAMLREDHELKPDLLIASGDLIEQGHKDEFEHAFQFITELAQSLELPRGRVVLVPGNHDVNREACLAYFSDCKSRGRQPEFPFWPKWREFHRMFQRFYHNETNITFTRQEPWTWYCIEDLRVSVAGLNSTMAEIHVQDDEHARRPDGGDCGWFGYCGEKQLSWFARRLTLPMNDGWLRIGVMHHNPVRAPEKENNNLRDLNDFRRILVPRLNLVLHGHTHFGALNWLDSCVPVLSTGSAGVKREERPEEVHNQYQIIQVFCDRFVRWTRYYSPTRKAWVADLDSSLSDNEWPVEHKTAFHNVHGALHNANATFDCTRDGFVHRLAQADTATIVGITNEGLADCLEAAWTIRQPNREWRDLRIVFLARNLLTHIRDQEDSDRPLESRQERWDEGVQRVRTYFTDRQRARHVEIRHSNVVLPFIGQLYDGKHARVAFVLPERDTRLNCYINFSTQHPPCKSHGLCLFPKQPATPVGDSIWRKNATGGETCDECPRGREKNSPCLAINETFNQITSFSTPLFAANVVGCLTGQPGEKTGFLYRCLIPQSGWKQFRYPGPVLGRPAHLVTFVLLRSGNKFLLLRRNESNAGDQFEKLSVVSGRVNDEDCFPNQPDPAHRQDIFDMQMAHYRLVDGCLTPLRFWKNAILPLAKIFASRVGVSIDTPIPNTRLETICRKAAVRYSQEKLRILVSPDRFELVPGAFVVDRGEYDLFPVLFLLRIEDTMERGLLPEMESRNAEKFVRDAHEGKLTSFLTYYADDIVKLLDLP